MSQLIVLHNNRCTKSRNALKVLDDHKIPYTINYYLEKALSESDLNVLLNKLNLNAIDIVRKSESIFKENFKGKEFSNKEWIKILSENPKLIERPILYNEEDATIGRPTENVITFINKHYYS